jgi:hypothetical protein
MGRPTGRSRASVFGAVISCSRRIRRSGPPGSSASGQSCSRTAPCYQGAVSAKLTGHGDLIIEQDTGWAQDCADSIHSIIVRSENVEQFINAVAFICREDAPRIQCDPAIVATKPRTDNTNAERQQRYRQRKRNADRNGGCNAVTP